jgi:hypothetical protein
MAWELANLQFLEPRETSASSKIIAWFSFARLISLLQAIELNASHSEIGILGFIFQAIHKAVFDLPSWF